MAEILGSTMTYTSLISCVHSTLVAFTSDMYQQWVIQYITQINLNLPLYMISCFLVDLSLKLLGI